MGSPRSGVFASRLEAAQVFRHLHVLPGGTDAALDEMGGAAVESLPDLAVTLEGKRRRGQRIVLARGTFDILHAGHVRFLRAARSVGDVLVVAINGDRPRRREGKRRAAVDERQRAALIAALALVDHVLIVDDDDPAALIRRLRPAIYVKGADHAGEHLPEFDVVREIGGQVLILPCFAIVPSGGERGAALSPGQP